MKKETIKLFRALPINNTGNNIIDANVHMATIPLGFVFSNDLAEDYSTAQLMSEIAAIDNLLGLSAAKMNATFHKSWAKVRDADYGQLLLEQIVHYITTYGFEALGVYDEASVYIPNEELELPDIDLGVLPLVVIRGYTKDEIKGKLKDLLGTGIALKEETVKDIVAVATWCGFSGEDVAAVKNKEAAAILYERMNIIPNNPNTMLRHLIHKATGYPMVIKSKATIAAIAEGDKKGVVEFFNEYVEQYGLKPLATIFLRNKPLFLAFRRGYPALKEDVNKIRRLAVNYHRPMKPDFLNNVTAMVKDKYVDPDGLDAALATASVFRKIRAAQALNFRAADIPSILYRVRNGKGYAKRFDTAKFDNELAGNVRDVILASIGETIKEQVSDKTIYIPSSIRYALPATEKQFTGNFPSGTSAFADENIVFGVNWHNVPGHRIDLDLSLISVTGEKFGWDGLYRDRKGSNKILFSGDITDAYGKNGATEVFYLAKGQKVETYAMYVNYFNYRPGVEVPFTIFAGKESVKGNLSKNHMVDPNYIIASAQTTINKKQKLLGYLSVSEDGCRFYFAETYVGNSISAGYNETTEHTLNYLSEFSKNIIGLESLLLRAGAELVDSPEEADINLAPENLEKDTIISILS